MATILEQFQTVFNNTHQAMKEVFEILEQARTDRRRIDEVERKLFSTLLKVGLAGLQDIVENAGDGDQGATLSTEEHGTLNVEREALQSVHKYFTTNRQRMNYGHYLKAGYPIGSSVIEGACKHIIGDRMCQTGVHWEFEGAQPMLDMRVTKLNDQWNSFIEYRIKIEQKKLYNQAA